MKKCSPSLDIKEMQIKSTLRFYFSPVRIATIKITNDNKFWQRCRVKGALIHCWWECKLVQPLSKTVQRLLQKLKIDLAYHPAVPLLQIYLKNHVYNRGTCIPMIFAALFTIAKLWKQTTYSNTDEWIKKHCIYMQWDFIQVQRMKFCCLHVNGWNWRTSS
jgi:hypothetical protein